MIITSRKQHGFTLVEVMAASVITAFIATVAVSGLVSVTSARKQIDQVSIVNDELRFVGDALRRDLAGFYRNKNALLFEGSTEESSGGAFPRLRFWTICSEKARPKLPEGDLYEVEYFLSQDDEGNAWIGQRKCPIVGNEEDPDQTDGGVVTRLAEHLSFFQLRYFDGDQWLLDWPMELERMPMLVEISLGAAVQEKSGKETFYTKQFYANFPRNGEEDEEMDLDLETEDPEETMSQS